MRELLCWSVRQVLLATEHLLAHSAMKTSEGERIILVIEVPERSGDHYRVWTGTLTESTEKGEKP